MLDMKNKILIAFPFLLLVLFSCKKEISKVYFEGGKAPVLSASTATVTLEPGLEANTALVLNWTNPDYKFTTGSSSQDVSYRLEFDTLGGGFSNSKKYSTVVAKDLSKTFTVAELNSILGNDMQLQLNPRRNYTIEVRVTSSLNSAVPIPSNVISFTAKPFVPPPKITPPASGKLYITGSATAGNWMGSGDAELVSQRFTKLSTTLYEITINLIGNGSYTFVPAYGDWSSKYSIKVKNDPNEIYGGEFQAQGEDILAPPVSGTYKITVNFQNGTFSVVKL